MQRPEDMHSGFTDAMGIVNDVKDLDFDSFEINAHQCMRLVGLYRRVGGFFESSADFPVNLAPLSLDATVSVLQKGQVLLRKYTADDWQESLMTGGLNQGSFEAMHLELESCIQSIYEFLQERGPGMKRFPLMKPGYQGKLIRLLHQDECDRATLLGEDAEKDRVDILAKIEVMKMETEEKVNISQGQRSLKILSLDVASETIKDPTPAHTASPEFHPSILRIKPSEIKALGVIGSGRNAVVRKCRYMEVDFAVKILKTGGKDGLRAEVGKFMNLRHPNIVPLFGFSGGKLPEPNPMIVMELLDGDLRLLLRRHPDLKLSKAVDVMHKVASGMAYLHRQKIFHGDLKSMNVLVKDVDSEFAQVKISDFGLSYQILGSNDGDHDGDDAVTSPWINGKVGTPMWMAPEVLMTSSGSGNYSYSAKADVYSFAMVCVEILTGNPPWETENLNTIRGFVVDEVRRPNLPLALPNDLRQLIVQCWDAKPERRPDFLQICTRLQMLKAHSPPLPLFSSDGCCMFCMFSSQTDGFRAAMLLALILIIFWTFGHFGTK